MFSYSLEDSMKLIYLYITVTKGLTGHALPSCIHTAKKYSMTCFLCYNIGM